MSAEYWYLLPVGFTIAVLAMSSGISAGNFWVRCISLGQIRATGSLLDDAGDHALRLGSGWCVTYSKRHSIAASYATTCPSLACGHSSCIPGARIEHLLAGFPVRTLRTGLWCADDGHAAAGRCGRICRQGPSRPLLLDRSFECPASAAAMNFHSIYLWNRGAMRRWCDCAHGWPVARLISVGAG